LERMNPTTDNEQENDITENKKQCSQEPYISPYPEPDQSSPYRLILFFEHQF
jgi:hypothetical protein